MLKVLCEGSSSALNYWTGIWTNTLECLQLSDEIQGVPEMSKWFCVSAALTESGQFECTELIMRESSLILYWAGVFIYFWIFCCCKTMNIRQQQQHSSCWTPNNSSKQAAFCILTNHDRTKTQAKLFLYRSYINAWIKPRTTDVWFLPIYAVV